MSLQPDRTVAELRELRELTGDENGAQRVAWTDTWERARDWLRGKLVDMPVTEQIDEAGNQWFTLPGASERALLIETYRELGEWPQSGDAAPVFEEEDAGQTVPR